MKPGMQIMFLFLALGVTILLSGQEPVSLTRDDLIAGTGRGIFMPIDLTNTVFAGKSLKMDGVKLACIHKYWFATGLSYYSLPASFS